MTRLKSLILFGALLLALGTLAAPRAVQAQSGWDDIWDAFKKDLIYVQTTPNRAYFDQIIAPEFPDRDRWFQQISAETAALSNLQVSYPIFIHEDGLAAYQRVVTGTFDHPYVLGDISIPPTHAPVRYLTQGILESNAYGQIDVDHSVTDAYTKAKEFGLVPLEPGEVHGQIGLEPYDGSAAFAPGTNPFTRFRLQQQPPPQPASHDTPYEQVVNTFTGDPASDLALPPDFFLHHMTDASLFAIGLPKTDSPPNVVLNGTLSMDGWTAGSLSIGLDLALAPPVANTPVPGGGYIFTGFNYEFSSFVMVHRGPNGEIDQVFANHDSPPSPEVMARDPNDPTALDPVKSLVPELGPSGMQRLQVWCRVPMVDPSHSAPFYPMPDPNSQSVESTLDMDTQLIITGIEAAAGDLFIKMGHGFYLSWSDTMAYVGGESALQGCSDKTLGALLNAQAGLIALSVTAPPSTNPPCVVHLIGNASYNVYDYPDPNSSKHPAFPLPVSNYAVEIQSFVQNPSGVWAVTSDERYIPLEDILKYAYDLWETTECVSMNFVLPGLSGH